MRTFHHHDQTFPAVAREEVMARKTTAVKSAQPASTNSVVSASASVDYKIVIEHCNS